MIGFNDLATTHPEIAKEWHPTKNEGLTPQNVVSGANKKVWWRCKNGHEWQATVYSRAVVKTGCPFCTGQKPIVGENDFATTHPQLSKEWHPTKNGNLLPQDVMAGSPKKVWWLGKCGHEWQAVISQRAKKNRGCPYCSNKKILIGFNDLVTTHPEIAKEWHPTKNGDLTPQDVVAGSNKKVWWLSADGREWQTKVKVRTRNNKKKKAC